MKRFPSLPLILLLFPPERCNKKIIQPEVANGDFNEPLNVGWHERAVNYSGDYRIERIKEGEEYYARIYKDACGYAQLEQKVMLTRLSSLLFSSLLSFRAKFFANSNNEEYASAGAVVIEYLNREMRKLGATKRRGQIH
uniref:Uncharacterized protein n=1 Tax=candidate division WOR-3 bacterium TaxID=2052148 RepID=A0A7C3UX77_UNCW3